MSLKDEVGAVVTGWLISDVPIDLFVIWASVNPGCVDLIATFLSLILGWLQIELFYWEVSILYVVFIIVSGFEIVDVHDHRIV